MRELLAIEGPVKTIIMQGASVRAIMAGVKVQTRRIDDGKPPRYAVGDRVYVKETLVCTRIEPGAGSDGGDRATVIYAADDSPCPVDRWPWQNFKLSPIYMPFGARRLDLVIRSRRNMRLQEISDDDARAEGVQVPPRDLEGDCWTDGGPRTAFEYAWNELHGWNPNAWQSNPKVWAYGFELIARLV